MYYIEIINDRFDDYYSYGNWSQEDYSQFIVIVFIRVINKI